MGKRYYQVGEPCDNCNTPTIASKKGGSAYCWPCWSKWKDAQKSPQTTQAPQNTQLPTQAQITQSVASDELVEALQKISSRLQGLEAAIEKNNWMFNEIMKAVNSKWNALSQDEIKPEDLP